MFSAVQSAAVLAVATFVTAPLAQAAVPITVILLGGQSNMDGRAATSGLPSGLQSPQPNVLQYDYVNGPLQTLRPTTSNGANGTNFGPDVTFGHDIAADNPNTRYALIKYSFGGTSLAVDWNATSNNGAGGTQYQNFKTTVTNGIAALKNAGYAPTIAGMLWLQGETDEDTKSYADAYATNFPAFISSIRGNYGADLPFMIGGTGHSSGEAYYNTVTAAQMSAAASIPNVAYFSNQDLLNQGMSTDGSGLHFNAQAQQIIGQRFETALATVPEPTTLAAIAAGSVLVLRRARRR